MRIDSSWGHVPTPPNADWGLRSSWAQGAGIRVAGPGVLRLIEHPAALLFHRNGLGQADVKTSSWDQLREARERDLLGASY